MNPDTLVGCVQYFSNGNIWHLIGGGITLAAAIYFSVTKHNLPSIFKDVGAFFMAKDTEKSPEDPK